VACCRMEAAMAAAVVDLPVVHEAREAAPIFLLSRSVGQAGMNSETTLGITRFQLEIRAFAGAAPDEFYVPSGARARPTKLPAIASACRSPTASCHDHPRPASGPRWAAGASKTVCGGIPLWDSA
jgi:hypothetical protein